MRIFFQSKKTGFTLIEVLVGIFLAIIFFLGILAAYQLAIRVIGFYQRKIIATSLANAEIEKIRNLPYPSIGIENGFPPGVLEPSTNVFRNNIEFKIERRVDYVIDPSDGIVPPEDECPNDYKRVEIKISWSGHFPGEVKFSTDFSPKNLSQECEVSGGILSISVFDAFGQMINSPLIEVKDPSTGQTLKTATPTQGTHYFALSPASYKVVVSKEGYSKEETFAPGESYQEKTIVTPVNPNLNVIEDQVTEKSFSIDKLSSFSVESLSPWGADSFSDSFLDESKIAEKSNLSLSGGKVTLATTPEGEYYSSGYLFSVIISPANLVEWQEFSFSDQEPEETDLKYQLYYFNGSEWVLIPESDLPGNSAGFDSSPVNLSSLSVKSYPKLKIKGIFLTNLSTSTPILEDWQLSWKTSQPTPIANVSFNLRGEKIVGQDAQENPIFKYSKDFTTDQDGKKEITNLEWDNYIFSLNPGSGLDLVNIDPSPQPISLAPETHLPVKIYLDSQNSLLVTVQNQETLGPIFSSQVHLFKADYDRTQYTDQKGQTLFIPLQSGNYNLEVSAPGYSSVSTNLSVSGDLTKIVKLEQLE